MSTVVIIGAGLAGLTTARAMQERGWQVTVVEANAAPALGTSFANGGMLTPSMADPWNAPGLLPYLLKSMGREDSSFLLRLGALPSMAAWCLRFLAHSNRRDYAAACEANFALARFSLRQLEAWKESLGLDFEHRDNGTLKIFRDAETQVKFQALAEGLAPLGLSYESMTAAEVVTHEAALSPIADELTGALWYPQDGSGNARVFCEQLAERLQADGAQLHYQQRLKRWSWGAGKLEGFETQDQHYVADALVVAAGVHSAAMLGPLGLSLMVRPVKGYSLSFDATGIEGLPQLPIIDEASHCAITPLGRDNNSGGVVQLRVAGTAELAGYNTEKTEQRIANVQSMLNGVLPEQAEALIQRGAEPWAGLRPMSADGMPYIGPVNKGKALEKLYLNTGHGHLGWTHCAGSAMLLADQLDGSVSQRTGGFTSAPSVFPYRANRVLCRG